MTVLILLDCILYTSMTRIDNGLYIFFMFECGHTFNLHAFLSQNQFKTSNQNKTKFPWCGVLYIIDLL